MNVTPHITCGQPPTFKFIIKNHTSEIDVRYNVPLGNGIFDPLLMFDSTETKFNHPPAITINNTPQPFTFNNIVDCMTPAGHPFLTAVDICLDHGYGVAKKNLEQRITDDPSASMLPVSHLVIANSVELVEKYCLGSVMHVDPLNSPKQCKLGIAQERSSLRRTQGAFGNGEVVMHQLNAVTFKPYPVEKKDVKPLFDALEKLKFGPQDKVMTQFILQKQTAVCNAKTYSERLDILKDLTRTVRALEANAPSQEIRKIISNLRETSTNFSIGKMKKAESIENEMSKLSLVDRCSSTLVANSKNILSALAAHRSSGGKTYFTQEGDIDVTKAADSFKNFKMKFKDQMPSCEGKEPASENKKEISPDDNERGLLKL